jgi:hypothetical protein
MKNLMFAQDEELISIQRERWINCDNHHKDIIRVGFVNALQSPNQVVSHTAAQILGIYLCVYLSMCLSIYMSFYLCVYLSINMQLIYIYI